MRVHFTGIVISLFAISLSSPIFGQTGERTRAQGNHAGITPAQAQGAMVRGEDNSATKNLPYDPHDLTGTWQIRCRAGCTLSNDPPPMTAWGQARFDAAKPGLGPRGQPLGNDPMMICDPLGIPRMLMYPATPIEIVQTPVSLFQFFDWFHTFRKIWTDGRALPTDDPDPRWFGYSIGKWEGNTFVVDSLGFDDRTWLDQLGYPHSDEMSLQERYQRVDHDTLQLTMTLTDPKAYTKPWVSDTKVSKLTKPVKFLESFCVPSDEEKYREEMRVPAVGPGAKTSP